MKTLKDYFNGIRAHAEVPERSVVLLLSVILGLTVALDQATKIYARAFFRGAETIRVIGDYFVIQYAVNNGSFLSLGSDLPEPWKWILLTFIPVLVLLYFILYTLFSKDLSRAERITLTIIISGGLSNIVDRILFDGWVTDFLHFSLWGPLRTGILNVADMYITFGVIVFLYFQFNKDRLHRQGTQEVGENSSD